MSVIFFWPSPLLAFPPINPWWLFPLIRGSHVTFLTWSNHCSTSDFRLHHTHVSHFHSFPFRNFISFFIFFPKWYSPMAAAFFTLLFLSFYIEVSVINSFYTCLSTKQSLYLTRKWLNKSIKSFYFCMCTESYFLFALIRN